MTFMKVYTDCIPCFFRQALESSRLSGCGASVQRKVLMDLAKALPDLPVRSSPPEMARIVSRIVSKYSRKKDSYADAKKKSNEAALAAYPILKARLTGSEDPLAYAVELAIAGNIIDYGAKNNLDVDAELARILAREETAIRHESRSLFDLGRFVGSIEAAHRILYLADNAGETVFDRILIERIKELYPSKEILYAVKSRPALNDALIEDAVFSGIDSVARIIASGSDAPGTVLSLCTPEFRRLFRAADMVISKGQGNFEALSGKTRREVFFLFMVKCPVIARHVDCRIGDVVLHCHPGGK